jgi:hypothetical protein
MIQQTCGVSGTPPPVSENACLLVSEVIDVTIGGSDLDAYDVIEIYRV